MNVLDIILFIPIAIGAWKGFRKGLIIELFTLLALLVGIYAAIHFSDYMAEVIHNNFNYDGEHTPIIEFVLTFLLVGAMVYLLGKAIEKVISTVKLSIFNKLGGLVFGAIKMMFVSAIIVIVIDAIDKRDNIIETKTKNESLLYQPLKTAGITIIPAIKESQLFNNKSLIEKFLDRDATLEDLKKEL
jgi:membrane protein required for colicin V production